MEKMTIKEFFLSRKGLAIHCDTKEKAIKLLKEFGKQGYKWKSGLSYLQRNYWNVCEDKTCYSNVWTYGTADYYQEEGFEIIEFEEIEF